MTSQRFSLSPTQRPSLRLTQRLQLRLKVLAAPRWKLPTLIENYSSTNKLIDLIPSQKNFRENLLEQMQLDLGYDEQKRKLLIEIIESLDDSGYCNENHLKNGSVAKEIQRDLMRWQERGIGSCNFLEFFLFQLRNNVKSSTATNATYNALKNEKKIIRFISVLRLLRRKLPLAIFSEILEKFVRGEFRTRPWIADLCEEQNALQLPDLRAEYVDGEWMISTDFISENVENWQLQEALEQRDALLKKIGNCLLTFQKRFFENGPLGLQPLEQRHLAKELTLSPSTISRAVNGKYISTPWGIFPLKNFFYRPSEHSPITIQYCLSKIVKNNPETLLWPRKKFSKKIECEFSISISTRHLQKF